MSPHRRTLIALVGAIACHACYTKEPAREGPSTPPANVAPPPPPGNVQAPTSAPAPAAAEPSSTSSGVEKSKAGARESEQRARPRPAAAPTGGVNRQLIGPERDDRAADEVPARKSAPTSPELLRQRLGAAVKLSTPDCPAARERRQAICDLAAEICRLVDDDPNVASVMQYCDDARKRCGEAGERISERCK